ncbi:MAG: Tad domain-containing protein [Actinomycetota bacterium]
MSRRGIFARLGEERGASAVLVTVLLVAMFTLVALVIDIAALRADARAGQATGDFAAMAGAMALDPVGGGNPYGGCVAAYQYFVANTRGLGNVPTPASACAAFASVPFCGATTPETAAVVQVPPYQVTIINPVPDGSPYMQGRLDVAIDGSPCQRIAVEVQRTRTYLFGGVLNATQGTSRPPAVARATAGKSLDGLVSLVLLDPTGCKALVASGQAKVFVMPVGNFPGIITVDSSASEVSGGTPTERKCTQATQDFSIDAFGTQNSKIQAGGVSELDCNVNNGLIFSFALMPGQNPGQAFEDIDVTGCRLVPRPIAGHRITRAPIDHRYNCKSSYPAYYGVAVAPCRDAATEAPHMDNLRNAIGATGIPAGFTSADSYFPTCKTQPSSPSIVIPPGNWYVSCGQLDLANEVIFQAPSNVVFEGTVNVGSSTGKLCVNVSSCADTTGSWDGYVYFRKGDTEQSQAVGNFEKDSFATLNLMRTMVYVDNGRVDLGAGSGGLTWIAPEAGFFEDLALWSERETQHLIGGQALLDIEGTFFTPFAFPFRFAGQGLQYQTKAQFVTFRLEVSGQGVLRMQPDPDRVTPIPLQGVLLIR